jgi:tRNA (mo5U34)-methyltransferase
MSSPPSLSDQEIHDRIAAVPHWYHQIEVRPGITTPGINDSARTLKQLQLPDRCDGMRVLDIGVRDGYFSFELERRGAEVVAIDYMDPNETGFPTAKELLGSRVQYVVDNVYELTPERYGAFDIVLFLGVLYHLRDPLLALDRLWDVAAENALLVLETQVLDHALLLADGSFRGLTDRDPDLGEVGLMQFYPGDTLRGDPTNYWAPNAACMRGMMRTAGFEVIGEDVQGTRGIWHGRRILDHTTLYHRRLEKGTLSQAREGAAPDASAPRPQVAPAEPAAAPPDAAPPGTEGMDEAARMELALAASDQRRRGVEDELAAARRYISSLEAEIKSKDAAYKALHEEAGRGAGAAPSGAPSGRGAGALGRLRGTAAKLRRRLG